MRWSMRLTADRAPPGAHRCMPSSVEPLTGYDMLPTISDAHEAARGCECSARTPARSPLRLLAQHGVVAAARHVTYPHAGAAAAGVVRDSHGERARAGSTARHPPSNQSHFDLKSSKRTR